MSAAAPLVAFEAGRFREALGHFASGITIVSGVVDGEPIGFTCQSFSSVSLEPPLVSFSVMRTSTTWPRLRAGSGFAVNILADDQAELSTQFARSGTDKWAGVSWSPSTRGNPLIDRTLMWVDCSLESEIDAGDHVIILARVHELSPPDWHTGHPLLFFKGQYRALA